MCSRLNGFEVDSCDLNLNDNLICFLFWHASQIWSIFNTTLGSPSTNSFLPSFLIILKFKWLNFLCYFQRVELELLTIRQIYFLIVFHSTIYIFFFLIPTITISLVVSFLTWHLSLENSTTYPLSQNWLVLSKLNFEPSTKDTSLIFNPLFIIALVPFVNHDFHFLRNHSWSFDAF